MASEGTPRGHTREPGAGAKPRIPDEMVSKWQRIVDLIAEIVGVPAGLVMKVDPPQIEVFLASDTQGNPYRKGERAKLDTGLYCETVMRDRAPLLVPDARKDRDWDHNPDIELGMVSYLGFPVEWPDGEIFGTICVLDDEENAYSDAHQALLGRFKETLDHDLRWVLDSAERRRAEKALQESEERFRDLVERAGLGILVDDERGRFGYFNDRFAELFGYSREEMAEQSIRTLVHPSDVEEILAIHEARVSGREAPARYEIQGIRADGSAVFLEVYASPLRVGERIVGSRAYFWDITDRKRAEETRRRLEERVQHGQKLESLGVLAGGVAHDFNNLLVGMLGHSSLPSRSSPPRARLEATSGRSSSPPSAPPTWQGRCWPTRDTATSWSGPST